MQCNPPDARDQVFGTPGRLCSRSVRRCCCEGRWGPHDPYYLRVLGSVIWHHLRDRVGTLAQGGGEAHAERVLPDLDGQPPFWQDRPVKGSEPERQRSGSGAPSPRVQDVDLRPILHCQI
jgi:hypothetical protein